MPDKRQGPRRELIEPGRTARLLENRSLILDDSRRRPLYFDGRFLAARDLAREQTYFLVRQAELGRAIGTGVATGLEVRTSVSRSSSTLEISAGHGLTLAGEMVALGRDTRVDLTDIALGEELDAQFGLRRRPRVPARTRTGLFYLALRPVEFATNPISAYPTSLEGRRRTRLGDVVEAAAVTLIPYADRDGRLEPDEHRLRARLAREIFVEAVDPALPTDVLPLAVVALERGRVEWLDTGLVRRRLGAGPRDILGLGIGGADLAEAYLEQYESQFEEIRAANGDRFNASDFFDALPAAGPMPHAGVDIASFQQSFFPSEIDSELALVPDDEIAPILEESFGMPAIDLTVGEEALASTQVQILVAVSRPRFGALADAIRAPRPLVRLGPRLSRTHTPRAILTSLRAPIFPIPRPPLQDAVDASWQDAWSARTGVYYARTRNFARASDAAGLAIRLTPDPDEFGREERVRDRARELRVTTAFDDITGRASVEGRAELVRLLDSAPVARSPLITESVVRDLEARERVDRAAVLDAAARLTSPEVTDGIERVRELRPELVENDTAVTNLAREGLVPELARIANRPASREALSAELAEIETAARRRGQPARTELRNLIRSRPIGG